MALKEILDVVTKTPILKSAMKGAEQMLNKSKYMFENSFKAFLANDHELAKKIEHMDDEVDNLNAKVNRKLLEYLAISSVRDVSFSMGLMGISINAERIADYSENIAELTLHIPEKINDTKYLDILKKMKENNIVIMGMCQDAFKSDNPSLAKEAIKLNDKSIKYRDQITKMLKTEKKVSQQRVIVYALLSFYLDRISAHMTNIADEIVGKSYMKKGEEEHHI